MVTSNSIVGKQTCEIHKESRHGQSLCNCQPPFKLFSFPSEKKDPEAREIWCKPTNRASTDGSQKIWAPGKKSRVCSLHFVDGEPTSANPYPTLYLGYPNCEQRAIKTIGMKRKSRNSFSANMKFTKTSKNVTTSNGQSSTSSSSSIPVDIASPIDDNNPIPIDTENPVPSDTPESQHWSHLNINIFSILITCYVFIITSIYFLINHLATVSYYMNKNIETLTEKAI